MNVKYLSILLATGGLAIGVTPALAETSQSSLSFTCQMNGEVPTTVARATNSDRTLDIFYWKQEALPNSVSADQLCNSVSAKLEDFSSRREHGLSAINFETSDPGGLPAICATGSDDMCTVLFTLSPTDEPIVTANEVLTAILNKNLQTEELKTTSRVRGVQSFSYKVSLLDLLGISSLKFFR